MTLKFTTTDLQKTVTNRTKIFDTQVKGLYANKTSNAVTFTYRYWNATAKKHDYAPVGTFHPVEFNVDHARAKARLLDTDVKVHGKDVTKAIRQEAIVAHNGTKTFNDVAALFVAYQGETVVRKGVKRERKESWKGDDYDLNRARAAFGTKPIGEVTNKDIHAALKQALAEHKVEACRSMLAVLTKLFRWAGDVDQEFITVNPMAFINSKSLELPAPHRKTRYLDDDELRTFWHGLDRPDIPCDRNTAIAYKLILATALRPSEVGLAQRGEIGNISKHQGGDGLPAYRIPAKRVKKRRVIVQPLNSLAQELIGELLADGIKDGPLFRGSQLRAHELGRSLRSQPAGTWRKKTKRVGVCEFLGLAPFTPHDLRRTATTHLGLHGVGSLDKGRILDHVAPQEGGSSVGVYDVSEHVEQTKRRRPTLDTLDGILREIIGPAPASNVVRLKVA